MDKYEGYIGKVLDGRYKIIELVGVGGMAFVLKAEDLVMNRIVAIKILNDQYNGDEQAVKRFINESKAVAMLSNKNIVCVYDVAIFPDIKYIVMEYLDGITLKEYIDNKGKLPWKEACVYTAQILRALEHAHSKDVIHRDIKPQNIILQKNGDIKITDFGIAKIPNMAPITITDKAIGTVYYISPEQASGKETSCASDIYSVGVMLYEAVTGKLPFIAENPVAIAMMQINDEPVLPHELEQEMPMGLSQVIMKAMRKDASQRFTDTRSMIKAINYVIKYPDVVFNNEEKDENEEPLPYIDINMIDTSEIEDYVVSEPELTVEKEPEIKTEETKKQKRKRKKEERQSHSLFPVISGVFFAFMIVAAIVGGYLLFKWVPLIFNGDDKVNNFNVSDFRGSTYSDSFKLDIEKENYIVTIEWAEFPNRGYNEIISQDPEPGPKIFSDGYCRITLTVNSSSGTLKVPNIKYKTETEAIKLLNQNGLKKYSVIRITDLYANEGQVIRCEPAAGEIVDSIQEIKIYVCSGSGVTTAKIMPNVVGLSVEEAIAKLDEAYYTYKVEYYENSDYVSDVIFEQSIGAYTSGHSAWTEVLIKVSVKSTNFEMPNLINKSKSEAELLLADYGLVLGTISYNPNSTVILGKVCDQNVIAKTMVKVGTVINITLSGYENQQLADPVPNVLNLTENEAVLRLRNAKYMVIVEYVTDITNIGLVKHQSLSAGTEGYAAETIITITVAKEEEEKFIPDLNGMTMSEAVIKLQELDVEIGIVTYDDKSVFTPGTIIDQSIEKGTKVIPGMTIDITISGLEE